MLTRIWIRRRPIPEGATGMSRHWHARSGHWQALVATVTQAGQVRQLIEGGGTSASGRATGSVACRGDLAAHLGSPSAPEPESRGLSWGLWQAKPRRDLAPSGELAEPEPDSGQAPKLSNSDSEPAARARGSLRSRAASSKSLARQKDPAPGPAPGPVPQ